MPEIAAPPAPAPTPPTPPPAPAPHPSSAPRPGEPRQMAESRSRLAGRVSEADGIPDKPKASKPAPAAPPAPAASPKPAEPQAAHPTKTAEAKPEPIPSEPAKEPAEPVLKAFDPLTEKPSKLPGPWQLKEKYQKEARQYEAEAIELRAKLAKLGDPESISKRIELAETRNRELEEVVQLKAFEKSEKYHREFAQPLQDAWNDALSTFSQLNVTEPDGTIRPATDQDLSYLAQLPVGKIDDEAEAMFGKSTRRALQHVDEIRKLAAASTKALAEARKKGAEQESQQATATRQAQEEVGRLWSESIAEDDSSKDFLKSREDDDEWNTALEKHRSFVESAIRGNAADPKLTSAERADLVKRKAALRGRAIGYGMRGIELKRAQATIATLEAELKAVKGTQPGNGDGRSDIIKALSASPQNRMQDRFNERMAAD